MLNKDFIIFAEKIEKNEPRMKYFSAYGLNMEELECIYKVLLKNTYICDFDISTPGIQFNDRAMTIFCKPYCTRKAMLIKEMREHVINNLDKLNERISKENKKVNKVLRNDKR